MKILSAEFIKSCPDPEQFPRDRLAEIAFAGRSNVGKSSLINSLLGRKGLAKVSGTPGKTRILNFFRITTGDSWRRTFYAVDLPGYGYAKVSKSVRAQWGPMIEGYLTGRADLRGILLLLDVRRREQHDRTAFEWLRGIGPQAIVVATKVDKLARGQRREALEAIRRELGLDETVPLLAYSAVTHEGRTELWGAIRSLLDGDV